MLGVSAFTVHVHYAADGSSYERVFSPALNKGDMFLYCRTYWWSFVAATTADLATGLES